MNVNALDSRGRTPFLAAITASADGAQHAQIVKQFLVDKRIAVKARAGNEKIALHLLAGCEYVVELLYL